MNERLCLERVVKETARDGAISSKRIDLYKARLLSPGGKQSRLDGAKKLEAMALPVSCRKRPRAAAPAQTAPGMC